MQAVVFTVADYLLARLKQLDVTEVFQIPGDYVKHFTQALERFPGIATIGAANELDAAYAADAYGRTRGLGAVSLQYGVSTFSALNAIAGAYVERSPVIVISASPGADARNITDMYGVTFHHSTGDLHADQNVFENVTVAARTLSTNVGAAEAIDDLIVEALTHSRPVYIACYKEVWGQPCSRPPRTPLKARELKGPPDALQNAVEQAWSMIAAAKKPVILAGEEVLRFGLCGLLQQIIDASGFVYTTTSLGKTVLDEGGPKFLGTYSDEAAIPSVIDAVLDADCVLCLGTLITDDYLIFIEKQYANMVLATAQGARAGYFKYPDVVMKEFMQALLAKFKGSKAYPGKAVAPPQPAYPEPWKSNSDPKFDAQPEVITFNRFFQHSMNFLAEAGHLDEIVMPLGVSSSMYVATNAYGMRQGSFIASAAWQCVGFETGAASGAQLGSRKRAWAVAGDGGVMMVCQAISTLAKYKLNGVIFVMSNQVYAIEQVYVDMSAFQTGQFDTFDILPHWNYLALAQAYGAEGFRLETVSDLKAALPQIWKVKDRPVLVEVVIPATDLAGQMKRLGSE
ncbi:thiamine pyrophosphate-binding protein [Acidovorax sp. GBBC 3334]|uniref:thiamine pyrophosphate-binding protein n=1 Tax=Acidovorax sp. GBBC 3334 TaxID=2940496 RepID=UPI002304C5B3|nr:thiamine pyrophosphate-binding protein [Acidovorax sp. GBBC 3334]MDA8456221.1 thiamine pyrophosphate-binding protein [Acidovorax sp. GBBC 3334]